MQPDPGTPHRHPENGVTAPFSEPSENPDVYPKLACQGPCRCDPDTGGGGCLLPLSGLQSPGFTPPPPAYNAVILLTAGCFPETPNTPSRPPQDTARPVRPAHTPRPPAPTGSPPAPGARHFFQTPPAPQAPPVLHCALGLPHPPHCQTANAWRARTAPPAPGRKQASGGTAGPLPARSGGPASGAWREERT